MRVLRASRCWERGFGDILGSEKTAGKEFFSVVSRESSCQNPIRIVDSYHHELFSACANAVISAQTQSRQRELIGDWLLIAFRMCIAAEVVKERPFVGRASILSGAAWSVAVAGDGCRFMGRTLDENCSARAPGFRHDRSITHSRGKI